MKRCACERRHDGRRVVLTGGPGAGKTAVLELIRHSFCNHVVMLSESAGILFGGGFPRGPDVALRESAQRAIFHVQRELEAIGDAAHAALVLCDRGTIDGAAFWPGGDPAGFWSSVGTTLESEQARYAAVIHLRTPPLGSGFYNHSNPLRVETEAEAAAIDQRIARLWATHPRRFEVPASANFLEKAAQALEILKAEMPECCRDRVTALSGYSPKGSVSGTPGAQRQWPGVQ
jgi:predicted ATPase